MQFSRIDLSALENEYGQVPSFHDAHVIGISWTERDLTISLYIYEVPRGLEIRSENDKHVIADLLWKNVQRAELFLTDHWLDEVRNQQTTDRVRSELIDQSTGQVGIIEAEELTVTRIQAPKAIFQGPNGESIDTIKFNL